jgi:6-phosphogluconolactonase
MPLPPELQRALGDKTPPDIEVLPDQDRLMRAAADHVVDAAAKAIASSGRFVVALAGGSTPKALYRLLATEPYASHVSWPQVHVGWGDERCLPPDDPASNYRMAREALLDHVPVLQPHVHRIRGEDPPGDAAAAYESELRDLFPVDERSSPTAAASCFDLVLLGMGDDGHTASIFPGMAAIRESRRWVEAVHVPAVAMWRVTLTPMAINVASQVIFLVSGSDKAAMLSQVLEGPRQFDALPAQAIAPISGKLRWLVDVAAAAQLSHGGQGRAT